jgi:dienelactone hydrolase
MVTVRFTPPGRCTFKKKLMNSKQPRFHSLLPGLALLLLTAAAAAPAMADITVSEIRIPMTAKGMFSDARVELAATVYKPEGAGPFPLMLMNHGAPRSKEDFPKVKNFFSWQARYFAQRGFVVINPVRRGYGASDGPWAENYFTCGNPDYIFAGSESAKDIRAALDYGRAQPYVDANHVVLLGQSAGGFGVLALSSQNPPGVIGTISFAGGRGSRGPDDVCNDKKLVAAFRHYASTTHVPMLWFYSENDRFFGPALARRMGRAYQDGGVDLDLEIVPPDGDDGHNFFRGKSNLAVWAPVTEAFFRKLALPLAPEKAPEPGQAQEAPSHEPD